MCMYASRREQAELLTPTGGQGETIPGVFNAVPAEAVLVGGRGGVVVFFWL